MALKLIFTEMNFSRYICNLDGCNLTLSTQSCPGEIQGVQR